MLGPVDTLTGTGDLVGSPAYMSPEQIQGLKTVDHRTDIWSLGTVLYEMLSGRLPHAGHESVGGLLVRICTIAPPPLSALVPGISREVSALVQRATEIDPNSRFQSCQEMLAAIRPLLPTDQNIAQHEIVVPTDTAAVDAGTRRDVRPRVVARDRNGSVQHRATASRIEDRTLRSPSRRLPLRILLVGAGALAMLLVLAVGLRREDRRRRPPLPRPPRRCRPRIPRRCWARPAIRKDAGCARSTAKAASAWRASASRWR